MSTIDHAHHADRSPEPKVIVRRKEPKGLRIPNAWVVTIGVVLLSIGGYVTTLQGLASRVTKVEETEERTRDLLSEMKGDVKLLLERTTPNKGFP